MASINYRYSVPAKRPETSSETPDVMAPLLEDARCVKRRRSAFCGLAGLQKFANR